MENTEKFKKLKIDFNDGVKYIFGNVKDYKMFENWIKIYDEKGLSCLVPVQNIRYILVEDEG